jgi:hypothetical protein
MGNDQILSTSGKFLCDVMEISEPVVRFSEEDELFDVPMV